MMRAAIQLQHEFEKKRKTQNYRNLNEHARKGAILFTGSSLMEQFPVCELCASAGITETVYNRGIGGFTTDEFLEHIHIQLLDLEPSKVFINIGTNDLNDDSIPVGERLGRLRANLSKIFDHAKASLPATEFFVMAYYPVREKYTGNDKLPEKDFASRTNALIDKANEMLAALAADYGYHFINANDGLADEDGQLKKEYTHDGVHLYANAYRVVFDKIKGLIK